MAESQKQMVTIVAVVAVVILVGLVIWFMRQESDDTLQIEIGDAAGVPTWIATAVNPGPAGPL